MSWQEAVEGATIVLTLVGEIIQVAKEELVDFLWMPMFRSSTKELLMQFLLVEAVEPSQMEQTQLLFIMAEL